MIQFKFSIFRTLTSAILVSLSLNACTSIRSVKRITATPGVQTNWDQVDPNGQTILFWHDYSRERGRVLEDILEGFNRTNPWSITVEASYQGSSYELYNQMRTVLNTSNNPDLVVAYPDQAATYQVAGALVDLNSLVASSRWGLAPEEQADFFTGLFNQDIFPTFENARLGFPLDYAMEVMAYNLDWLTELREAGKIDFDGVPQTPEQFMSAVCAATQSPYSKARGIESIGFEFRGAEEASAFISWVFAFGGDIYDYEENQFTFNSTNAIQAMTFLQDLFRNGCATRVIREYADQEDFSAGKLLAATSSTSSLPFLKNDVARRAAFHWTIAPIPHTTQDPVVTISGARFSIPKSTPEQELAAWLFVKYFTSPKIQARWVETSDTLPVRTSTSVYLGNYFEANPPYRAAFDWLPSGKFEPSLPGYDSICELVTEAAAAIVSEPYPDVRSTLEALNQAANEILDAYFH